MVFAVDEVTRVAADIDGQIYARDFKLIDQSDMIVSYIPELPDGKPGLSSGVERELQHAYETTKEVYVVWQPKAEPSPFVTNTATAVFGSVAEAMTHFQRKGYVQEYQLRLDSDQPAATTRPAGVRRHDSLDVNSLRSSITPCSSPRRPRRPSTSCATRPCGTSSWPCA